MDSIVDDKALKPPNITKTNDEKTPKIAIKSVYIDVFNLLISSNVEEAF